MNILLIFNKGCSSDMKVLVRIHTKSLKETVSNLIQNNQEKEAFKLIISKAQVKDYIPPGKRIPVRPALTLVEDLLD